MLAYVKGKDMVREYSIDPSLPDGDRNNLETDLCDFDDDDNLDLDEDEDLLNTD